MRTPSLYNTANDCFPLCQETSFMLKYLLPHLLESGFTERPPESERITDLISLILRYDNFTVVCKYRPELNFDNLKKLLSPSNFPCVMGVFHESFNFKS